MEPVAFPRPSLEDWRKLVDKELGGKPFEKALVHEALPGLSVAPLYVEGPAPAGVLRGTGAFAVALRHGADATPASLAEDLGEGTDALWVPWSAAGHLPSGASAVVGVDEAPDLEAVTALAARLGTCVLAQDPFSRGSDLQAAARLAKALAGRTRSALVVSTTPHHDRGADAADEVAFALSTGVAYLEACLEAGLSIDDATATISFRVAVGRDTFVEIAKLRALRVAWAKVTTAAGASTGTPRAFVHAVCSSVTLAARDPWVNMLRTTTQVFAAAVGGADWVTPTAYDGLFERPSALGHRVARNTGLVLREEAGLSRVADPAAGSYHFESLTDALAREAWKRFQALERDGGIAQALADGSLARRLDEAWSRRLDRLARRKDAVLGVSEFANLGETLPGRAPPLSGDVRRDAAPFEALRLRADAAAVRPEVVLVTLGAFAESRGRAGFSATFFAAGGLATRESTVDEACEVACLCGTDERYADEAVARVRSLKAAGAKRVFLAGRPGALEAALREAGLDGFVFVGCDAVGVLSAVLDHVLGAEVRS